MNKRYVHDGIIGAVVTAGIAAGYYISPVWLLVPAVIGVVMIQSSFSGFCPLYYMLEKISPDK